MTISQQQTNTDANSVNLQPEPQVTTALEAKMQLRVVLSMLQLARWLGIAPLFAGVSILLLPWQGQLGELQYGAYIISALLIFYNGYYWLRVSFDQYLLRQLLTAFETHTHSSLENLNDDVAEIEQRLLSALDHGLVSVKLIAPGAENRSLAERSEGIRKLIKRLFIGAGLQLMLMMFCLLS